MWGEKSNISKCAVSCLLPQEGGPAKGRFSFLARQTFDVFAGGDPGFPAEHLGKVIGIGKAGGLGYIGDGGVFAPEEKLGILHSQMSNVPSGRDAGLLGEAADEVGL